MSKPKAGVSKQVLLRGTVIFESLYTKRVSNPDRPDDAKYGVTFKVPKGGPEAKKLKEVALAVLKEANCPDKKEKFQKAVKDGNTDKYWGNYKTDDGDYPNHDHLIISANNKQEFPIYKDVNGSSVKDNTKGLISWGDDVIVALNAYYGFKKEVLVRLSDGSTQRKNIPAYFCFYLGSIELLKSNAERGTSQNFENVFSKAKEGMEDLEDSSDSLDDFEDEAPKEEVKAKPKKRTRKAKPKKEEAQLELEDNEVKDEQAGDDTLPF